MNSEERKCLLEEKKQKYGVCVEPKQEEEDKKKYESLQESSEGGSQWLVVAASFLCICVLDGTMYSFGVFLEPVMTELKQSRGTISLAGSMQVALSAFSAPVASHLVTKTGARNVCLVGAVTASFGLLLASFGSNLVGIFVGLSLLTGIGFGLMYIAAVVVVAETFTTKRSLALGLSLCGAGAGQIGMAPLVSWVVGCWGWRVGLQVLAGVTLGSAWLGMVMKGEKGQSQDAATAKSNCMQDEEEVKQRSCWSLILGNGIASQEHVHVFLVMVLADALAVMALYLPYSYLKPVAVAAGVAPHLSIVLISAIGVGSVSGRLLSGWMSDQPWCHPLFLTRAVVSISCAIPFILAWVDHFWMFIGLSIIFGFLTGKWIAATSPLLISLLGIQHLSHAFGLLTAVRGVASLVSPPLAGMLVDLTINPLHALYLSGLLLAVSGLIYSLAVWVLEKRKRMNVLYQEI